MMKKILGVLLFSVIVIVAAFPGFRANASTTEVNDDDIVKQGYCGAEDDGANISWTIDKNGTLAFHGSGIKRDYAQSEKEGEFAPWANYYSTLYVRFDDAIENIGEFAFQSTRINGVEWNNHVQRIGKYAFFNAQWKHVEIPESVISIMPSSFGSRGISTISVDERNPVYDSRNDCNAIIETKTNNLVLGCQSTVIPSGIRSIGQLAFFGSKIEEINIPEGVESLGEQAFDGCNNLKAVGLPKSLKTIDFRAFGDLNSLTDVYYCGSETDWESVSVIGYNVALENANMHFNSNLIIHIPAKAATYTEEGNCEYWHLLGSDKYYSDENGLNEIEKGSWIIPKLVLENGLVTIDGKTYYYENGVAKTGWIKETSTSGTSELTTWYYANSDGVLATGWMKSGNSWYYMDPETFAMKTGWVKDGDNWYYMNSSGAMLTGWIKSNGNWYYAKSSGALAKGWEKIGGTWYYFSKDDCSMYSDGSYEIDGKYYYFYASGAMGTGWCSEKRSSSWTVWYYANGSGVLQTAWQKIRGVWYYFYNDGRMVQDCVEIIDNTRYAFNKSGAWISGTGWQKIGGNWWVYTQKGTVLTGWQRLNGTWYYFYPNSGYMVSINTLIDGKIEQFSSSGAWTGTRKTIGWVLLFYDHDWYYVEDTNGNLAKGWRTINGVTYYFSLSDGSMYYDDGSFRAIASEIDGKNYHFDENGALRTGRIDTIYGYSLYADENGELQRGWLTIDGNQYYCISDDDRPDTFVMYCDGIFTIDDVDYYFDENGVCQGEAGHVD